MTKDSGNDDLWIDFIEDELDPSLREDMQRLLARSEKEKAVCTRYETLRGAIEDSTDVRDERTFIESFDFDALHAKIMAQIPEAPVENRRPPARRSTANATLRRLSSRARNVVIPSLMGGLLVASFALHHLMKPSTLEARETDFSQHLVASSQIGAVVGGHSFLGEDLATAAASEKLQRMSDREARALFKSL